MIQKTRHLDSIVARSMLVADFIDSIGQKRTWRHVRIMSVIPLIVLQNSPMARVGSLWGVLEHDALLCSAVTCH